MDCIILAAGKGTRLAPLTDHTPKSLIAVAGTPIIERTLSSLPYSVSRVLIIIGHLGEKIVNHLDAKKISLPISYIRLDEILGTGHAIQAAKPFIKSDRFMILNGDDIYDKDELTALASHDMSFALAKALPKSLKYLSISLDEKNCIAGYKYPKSLEENILIGTGAYVLNNDIFDIPLIPIADGKEYGLPQAVLKLAETHPIKGQIMKKWIQINTSEDIRNAERHLKHPA